MITKEEVEKLLSYNPLTGVFTNKETGNVVGSNTKGYLSVMINYRNYRLHRLVFLLEDGEFPKKQVDHINGDRADNRRENLRKATNHQNSHNKASKGVFYHEDLNKFRAYAHNDYRQIHLGYYKTYYEAFKVADEKRKEIKGEFQRGASL